MKQLADKIILFLLSVFAMQVCLHGRYLVAVIYAVIMYAAICFRFNISEDDDQKIRRTLQTAFQCVGAVLSAAICGGISAAPMLLYDMTACKNYLAIGGLVAVAQVDQLCLQAFIPCRPNGKKHGNDA